MTRPLVAGLGWLGLACIGPVALLLARPGADDPERYLFESRLFYWTMPVVVLGAAAAAGWRLRRGATPVRDAWRAHWPGLLLAAALTALVFALVPPAMRVQFDETSLVNVSQNMHERRAAAMTTGAVLFEGQLLRLENTIDKRPPLFAFLVSVVHDLTGQRVANAFAVNALLLATALFVAFAAVRRSLGLAAALAAPLLLLAVPLTTVVATSAGFDLLAAVLFGVTVLAARDFVRQPDDPRCVALLASGMVFAMSRYESLFAFVLIAALAGWQTWRRWTPSLPTKLALAACPALLTPLGFLLQIARSPNFYPEAGGADLVAWRHLTEHLGPFVANTFAPALANPLPGVLAIAAVPCWIAWVVRRRAARADLLAVVPVLAVTAAALAWFFGDVRDPMALRLFLPFVFATALAPLLLPALFGARTAPWLLGAAALLAALRVHEVRAGNAFPRLDGQAVTEAIETAVSRVDTDPKTTLWVTVAAQHLATLGVPALAPEAFVRHEAQVQRGLASRQIGAIFVVETPIDAAFAPAYGDPVALLRPGRSTVVLRTGGEPPVTVHRLSR